MIQLIVQGEELDLFKSEEFAISKAVSKVGQFDLRFGDVSIGFNVPLTAKNNRIFRYISNLNNKNIGAFKRFEGEIREDDAILSKGFYQVFTSNQNKKQIKIRFLGGNSDWFDLIKDRYINENYPKIIGNPNSTSYSLNYLNHKFLAADITSSRSSSDGYLYFISDTGIDSNKSDNIILLKDFQLGVYEHTIFKNIFESVGIKIKGSMFNDPLYKSTIVNKPTDLTAFEKQNNFKRFTPTLNEQVPSIVLGTDADFKGINFTLSDIDTQWNGYVFTSNSDYDNILFSGSVVTDSNNNNFNLSGARIDVRVLVNGVEEDRSTSAPTSNSNNTSLQFSWSFEFDGVNLPVITDGDVVEIQYKSNSFASNFIPTVLQNGANQSIQSYLSYQIEGAITPFDINSAVPKIKQSDFVKDIMFRLGAISRYDSKKRIVYFDKFQDVEKNKSKAIDLTSKVDVSKDIEIDFNKLVSNYKKRSIIKYKEDNNDVQLRLFKDVTKNGLGDAVIEIDNDNLTDEGNIFESQYAATFQKITWSDNFYVPYIPVYNADGTTNDLKPRVLVTSVSTPVNNFSSLYTNIELDTATIPIKNSIGYAFFAKQITDEIGVINNDLDSNNQTLSFFNYKEAGQTYIGDTLLEKNFDLYRKILDNPIYLPIYLNLNNLDVQNYDPLTPIWLDLGIYTGYYYWEEISQYKGNGTTTKCALVKI